MADFFIQTDKEFYFAGDTVNGQIFINVGTIITGATGVSLKFTGYQCVKWINATQLRRPQPNPHAKPGTPPPHDPIAAIPPNQLYNHPTDNIVVSDVQSQQDNSYDHRPKYIRTPSNRYFRMEYFQTRNMFTKSQSMIYQCNGFAPGQYSFPFSFKTFEGWPASFRHITPKKKGLIIYRMTVAIQPTTSSFQLKYSRQINLRQTRVLSGQLKKSNAQITSCCCISKGITVSSVHFQKDGFAPGELVQMIMEIDNSGCQADIPTINISIGSTVTMRSNQSSTVDRGTILTKQINGVGAGQKATGSQAIREAFVLNSKGQIQPTCSGKLLSNQYSLSVMMNHDVSCDCCSDRVGVSIPIILLPALLTYNMPNVFQNNWHPKAMPLTNLAVTNDFNNFNLNQMQQNYPPQNQGYPPAQQNYPPGQQGQQPPGHQGHPPGQQGYPPGQQGYPPGQQGYPPGQQGYPPGQQGYTQQNFQMSNMQMN